jgi:hypothetical protein
MDHNDWVRQCEDVARTLRQILDRGSVPLTTEEEFRFQEYLDANELGLASIFSAGKSRMPLLQFRPKCTT